MLWKDDKLSKIRDFSCLKGWFAIVTINLTASYGRISYKRCKMTGSIHEKPLDNELAAFEDTITSSQPDPAKSAETKEAIAHIEERIASLNAKERRALRLKVYDGKTQRDIARIMDITDNTAASLVRRAKIKVQGGMGD